MGLENYIDQLDPENQDAVIWRFINMKKFADLMATSELNFHRADLFEDESEAMPPDNYFPSPNLNPLDLRDKQTLDNSVGAIAQFREAFYISCWYLFREETCKMWKDYGADGVAVCSRYSLLKSALCELPDRVFLGQVRYGGASEMTGYNTVRFVTTKRPEYADEQEVRAILWIIDPYAGINRHIDIDNRVHARPLTSPPPRVLEDHRRKVNLQTLATEIVVTPWASAAIFGNVERMVADGGYSIPVRPSELTRFREFLPSSDAQ